MKMMRVYTGADDESHIEEVAVDWAEGDGMRTALERGSAVVFAQRVDGNFSDFHTAPRRQYVLYLTASVELGLGDGSSVLMEPATCSAPRTRRAMATRRRCDGAASAPSYTWKTDPLRVERDAC